jgi:type IV secretion system protein VirB9
VTWRIAFLLLGSSAAASAQPGPPPVSASQKIRVVDYVPDQVFRIEGEPGFQVTLQLGTDERIENVAVGDSTAWQVTANARGDLLFIKPLRPGFATNMTVATDVRIYLFELRPASGLSPNVPYMVKFSYPVLATQAAAAKPQVATAGQYRLSGARALRPSWIGDDGKKTFIEWPADVALPAVFTVDDQGREALVNGNMRDERYVIDSVLPKLIFRIDNATASAVRITTNTP